MELMRRDLQECNPQIRISAGDLFLQENLSGRMAEFEQDPASWDIDVDDQLQNLILGLQTNFGRSWEHSNKTIFSMNVNHSSIVGYLSLSLSKPSHMGRTSKK